MRKFQLFNTNNHFFKILISSAIGGGFLWLALSQTNLHELKMLCAKLNWTWVIFSMLSYSMAVLFRIFRWYWLLRATAPLTFKAVGVALIVGYAMNNVLPARLGELLRVDYCKRKHQVSRSHILGSIILERLLDGIIVVLLLGLGLYSLYEVNESYRIVFSLATFSACLFGVVLIAVFFLLHLKLDAFLNRWPFLTSRLYAIQESFKIIENKRILLKVILISLVVWIFEVFCLWLVLRTAGINASIMQMFLVVGLVSLSTLLPSPPGYLGTLQYAFSLILIAMGYTATQGVFAAGIVQTFLMGFMTISGVILFLYTNPYHFGKKDRWFREQNIEKNNEVLES